MKTPHAQKGALNGMKYLLAFLLMSVVFPAWGVADEMRSKGETGTKPADFAGLSGKFDEKIVRAKEIIKAQPSNSNAHVRLATLLMKKGALDEAMVSFDEAIKINPRSCEAKTGRGIVFARKGNRKEAERVLKDALILNPNPVGTHYELGLLYQQLNEYDKAVAEFKKGIKKHEQGRM